MGKKLFPVFLFGMVQTICVLAGASKDPGGFPAGSPGGTISLSCYDSMTYRNFLEQGAKLFEERYPGTQVEVQTFSAMPELRSSETGNVRANVIQAQDDPRSRIDYINRVNTALMSGAGADIYAMDILPVHKYAEGKQLENLENYIAGDPGWIAADFRSNILEAVKYRGALWFIPMDYSFYYYAYDKTLFPRETDFGPEKSFTTAALMDMAKPWFNGAARIFNTLDYLPGSAGGMFNQLLHENYRSLVNPETKEANFTGGVFVKILESVKEYAEAGYIPRSISQSAGGRADPGEMLRRSQGQDTDRYFFKLNTNFSLVSQFNRNSGRRMMMRSSGNSGGIEDDDEIAGIKANEKGDIPFSFSQAYGINANSQNKGTAWEFLKFLLSPEMQTSTALSPMALPLNNRAREEKAELILSGAFMGRGEPLDEKQREVLQKYITATETLSDQINCYVFEDMVINDMINTEAAYFFRGTKTAAEAAAVLQNKVSLYLNE
jgi:ABC-type glycerol-3-phosphate transport system substrate-binding protein